MPSTQLVPTANGTDTAWALGAGSSKWEAMSPPDDSDTSHVSTTSNSRMGCAMSDLDVSAQSISTHTLTRRTRKVSGTTSNINGFVLLGGSYTDGSGVIDSTSYADRTDVDLARPGGGTWTPADINSAEAGVRRGGGGADEDRCTTLKWDVFWLPAEGDFAAFAACKLPFIIGGGLLLGEMGKLAALIHKLTRGKTRILKSEFEWLYRELQVYPYRRYAFQGAVA